MGLNWGVSEGGPQPGNLILVFYFSLASFLAHFLLDRFVYKLCAMRLLGYKTHVRMNDVAKWSKIVKCTESMWKLTYYATVEIWALSIIQREPWSLDTKQYFKGWPNQELKSSVMLFYMCQCGFYLYSIVALVTWETRRKDFSIMMSHHIVTSILIGFSYITSYDSIEALSWMDNFPTMLYYIFNMMLLTLLIFHIYWWKLIFAMVLKQLRNRGKVGEDIRSDSEDED
ncbi:hypothetical protein ZIOFF_060018 [Zingiber officinale]|uniref:TLC domain-containing protein n=1 Tax=Zingiber officinale TaxID=94328 RepID=A0A8J5FB47_ZINOF|nr:hypothetical protein ZIOFF_060018 [Zingiber officinale]